MDPRPRAGRTRRADSTLRVERRADLPLAAERVRVPSVDPDLPTQITGFGAMSKHLAKATSRLDIPLRSISHTVISGSP
jgi:hypothetical protein